MNLSYRQLELPDILDEPDATDVAHVADGVKSSIATIENGAAAKMTLAAVEHLI